MGKNNIIVLLILSLNLSIYSQLQDTHPPVEHYRTLAFYNDTASLKNPKTNKSQETKLPYPIIFIHGLWANSSTWNTTTTWMENQYGFTYGGRLDYCLNYDGDNNTSNTDFYPTSGADIAFFSSTLIAGDYYCLNFDVGNDGTYSPSLTSNSYVRSNQSAIVKQGVALKWAINSVLTITGRDKVILMGHSMGGLTAREYLQNPNNWQADGKHHVAKLVTTATPHGGTNTTTVAGYGADGQSDAIRDLRRSYYYSSNPGVYLFGGIEDEVYMEDQLVYYFYNTDVNCNGIQGEPITGLNQKTIPTDVSYSCIIGECSICVNDISIGDGAVNANCANLNNYYPNLNASLFYYYDNSTTSEIHTLLPTLNFQNMLGLDEPGEMDLAYQINFDSIYVGFSTFQPSGTSGIDKDCYYFNLTESSNVTLSIDNIAADLFVRIMDSSQNVILSSVSNNGSSMINLSQALNQGKYYLEFSSMPSSTSHSSPYNFNLTKTSTVGINDNNNHQQTIYPNPSASIIYLDGTNNLGKEYKIVSVLGEEMLRGRITSNHHSINIESLNSNIYFLIIQDKKLKFIKAQQH